MRAWLAIRVFFQVLLNAATAQAVREVFDGPSPVTPADKKPLPPEPAVRTVPAAEKRPQRSDAVSLLATLQREARLIDMIKEPLGSYNDAQVAAAARDVFRDCGRVIDRLFDVRPVVEQAEGSAVEVPAGYDPGLYRLTGNVSGEPPFRGRLVHHGWVAARCELPSWSGSAAARLVVAPQEVEVG